MLYYSDHIVFIIVSYYHKCERDFLLETTAGVLVDNVSCVMTIDSEVTIFFFHSASK